MTTMRVLTTAAAALLATAANALDVEEQKAVTQSRRRAVAAEESISPAATPIEAEFAEKDRFFAFSHETG